MYTAGCETDLLKVTQMFQQQCNANSQYNLTKAVECAGILIANTVCSVYNTAGYDIP